jgi:hypothetical protein
MSTLIRNGLHLGALCSFAIARQYFEPLADGPDFFIDNGASGADVLLFALGFVLLPPLFLLALEALVGLAGQRPRDLLHLGFVAGLVGLLGWQAMIEAGASAIVADVVGLVAAAFGGVAYPRSQPVRSFLTALSPAPFVVLMLFLVFSPLRAMAFGGGGDAPPQGVRAGAPIVMVVLDELPTASLLDAQGRIDARRYPGFARLARSSTWYPKAVTVADYTQNAVPALLTGRRPEHGKLQVAAEHPRSLFTLLGDAWRVDAFEALTDLCGAPCPEQRRAPLGRRIRHLASTAVHDIPALPKRMRDRLSDAISPSGAARTDTSETTEGVRRMDLGSQPSRFEHFLETLRTPAARPPFHFLHLVLPHRPWHYLPSGQGYFSPRGIYARLFGRLPRDEWTTQIAWQRHLLQLQFTDRLLSRLIDRLEARGLWEGALVVVTADHGAAFQPSGEMRILTRANVAEVASVPLFVKAPRQRAGRVDDAPVELIDVVPELARQLRVRLPWRVDGTATSRVRGRRRVTVMRQEDGEPITVSRSSLDRELLAAVRRRLRAFPSGDPFALGPRRELVGRRPRGLLPLPAKIDPPGRDRISAPAARALPVDVSGDVRAGPARRRPIAVAVNGRIGATAFTMLSGGAESFTVLVPPSALRAGSNRVEVLAL